MTVIRAMGLAQVETTLPRVLACIAHLSEVRPLISDLADGVTCHGIFPPTATRVRPIERTDNEANNSNRRADHRDSAGA